MGYLLHLLVALLGQGLAEGGWSTGWRVPWAALPLMLVPYVLAGIARRASLRGRFRRAALVHRILAGAGPALHVLTVCGFGWLESLRLWFGDGIALGSWPRVGLLLALLPFVAYEIASIDARARLATALGAERRAWRTFQVRMLLSGLVPLVCFVLVSAAIGASDAVRIEIEEVQLYAAAFAGALLVLLAFLLPSLLRNVWDTKPFPTGHQRDVLQAVADRARFRARALLAWNTGDLMANAAIVGIGPRTRIVLFSDSLLDQLDASELAAVFAHEIGHAVRRHVLVFVSWAGAVFLLADLAAHQFFPDEPWIAGGVVLAAVGAWLLAFGFASRRFELEADLYCLDLLGDASPLIRALEKVGGRFRDVASWRHFSTAERVRFLERAMHDAAVGQGLRRSLRRWTRLGVGLLLVALGLQAWVLGRSFDQDRLRADLRLGQYASARSRAGRIRDLDPLLARLTERAASIGRDAPPLAELEEKARDAMSRGEVADGLAWLDLGGMRGSGEMDAVAAALRSLAERGDASSLDLDPVLLGKWRVELDACRGRFREGSPAADQ